MSTEALGRRRCLPFLLYQFSDVGFSNDECPFKVVKRGRLSISIKTLFLAITSFLFIEQVTSVLLSVNEVQF